MNTKDDLKEVRFKHLSLYLWFVISNNQLLQAYPMEPRVLKHHFNTGRVQTLWKRRTLVVRENQLQNLLKWPNVNEWLLKGEEDFEDTSGVIRIRISQKNRQHNGQKKKYKQRSTKHTHKTKDRVTRTPLKTGGELKCFGRVSSSCYTSGTREF